MPKDPLQIRVPKNSKIKLVPASANVTTTDKEYLRNYDPAKTPSNAWVGYHYEHHWSSGMLAVINAVCDDWTTAQRKRIEALAKQIGNEELMMRLAAWIVNEQHREGVWEIDEFIAAAATHENKPVKRQKILKEAIEKHLAEGYEELPALHDLVPTHQSRKDGVTRHVNDLKKNAPQ